MELYTLDNLFRRQNVIDDFKSLIWTERWVELGDFELEVASNYKYRHWLVEGTRLAMNKSSRVMTVESWEESISPEGETTLKIKGKSLEDVLSDRIAYRDKINTLSIGAAPQNWVIAGMTPGNVGRYMFQKICVEGQVTTLDILPNTTVGSDLFPVDDIPEPTYETSWYQKIDTLLNAIQSLCKVYAFGFRLVRMGDNGQFQFDIYTGTDRTLDVTFAAALETLDNTRDYRTIENEKNAVCVVSNVGATIVYPAGTDPNISGYERKVHVLNIGDIELPEEMGSEGRYIYIYQTLTQRGVEELAQYTRTEVFDGELNQYNTYIYGTDYNLGDLVTVQNTDGDLKTRRVVEQIFVSDGEGERAYPSLSDPAIYVTGSPSEEEGAATTWEEIPDGVVWTDYTNQVWTDL